MMVWIHDSPRFHGIWWGTVPRGMACREGAPALPGTHGKTVTPDCAFQWGLYLVDPRQSSCGRRCLLDGPPGLPCVPAMRDGEIPYVLLEITAFAIGGTNKHVHPRYRDAWFISRKSFRRGEGPGRDRVFPAGIWK